MEGTTGPGPIDVYTDQMGMTLGPFGCSINFMRSPSVPPAGGIGGVGQPVATVRMSLEHLKTMIFLLKRQVSQYEQQGGIRVPIPMDVLNQLKIGLEDWEQLWGTDRR